MTIGANGHPRPELVVDHNLHLTQLGCLEWSTVVTPVVYAVQERDRQLKGCDRLFRAVLIACLAVALVACEGLGGAALADFGFRDTLPRAIVFDATLGARLARAWADRPAGYAPRTQHLQDDGTPAYINRLFLESSPYLQQHAHNPVNWFPWGDEAFDLAQALGRPVLLSIGYSTCHWCHVMEDESFDDEEVAAYINEHYVAIKVDRELRPDLDSIYMNAVQLFTQGGGGWPMTLWLTPERQPYSGGTYFPARDGDRGVAIGFLTLLERLKVAYAEEPDRVADVSGRVAERIRASLTPTAVDGAIPDATPLETAASFYRQRFDADHGGLRSRTKFPSSMSVRLLLREHRRTGDDAALGMVTRTLERIAAGGIHDHVAGGFHRYATDEAWLVPHFEKMLYDNAQLVVAYLEAYQATGREDFADVARSILRYVERDMTSPDGGFYSATDADSVAPGGEREEGWFFTWTPEEVRAAIGPERAAAVNAYFGVTTEGNFDGGRTVLHVARPLVEVARDLGMPPAELRRVIDESRELLYAARAVRPAPLRDEKILTSWNGLMISAFAKAALTLTEPSYAVRAAAAAERVLARRRPDGRLVRDAAGDLAQAAYLNDYAFLVSGLLDLYEATGDARWLRDALGLDVVLETHFEDAEHGGFFLTADDNEILLAREKPQYDSAEPSGNAVQLLNLVRLHEFTTDDRFRQRLERALGAFAGTLDSAPTSAAEMLLALDYHLDTAKEVIIVVPEERAEAAPFLDRFSATFLPNRILAVAVEGDDLDEQAAVVPLIAAKYAIDGRATAYVCENRVCDLPTTDVEVFTQQIRSTGSLIDPH